MKEHCEKKTLDLLKGGPKQITVLFLVGTLFGWIKCGLSIWKITKSTLRKPYLFHGNVRLPCQIQVYFFFSFSYHKISLTLLSMNGKKSWKSIDSHMIWKKIHEHPWKTMKIHENPWTSMNISGFPQKTPGFFSENSHGNAGSTDPSRVFGFPRRIAPAVPVLGCGEIFYGNFLYP